MSYEKLTSQTLLNAAREVEDLQSRVADYGIRFSQLYGPQNANLLKEVLEQRAVQEEAREYAQALIASADLTDEEIEAMNSA